MRAGDMARHLVVIEPAAEILCLVHLREHSRAIAETPHWGAGQPLNALANSSEMVDQAHWVADLRMSLALLGAESEDSLEQRAGRSAAVLEAPDWHMPAETEFGHILAGMSLSGSKAFVWDAARGCTLASVPPRCMRCQNLAERRKVRKQGTWT
jgi:hypothetical protein